MESVCSQYAGDRQAIGIFCRHIVRVLSSHQAVLTMCKEGTQQKVCTGIHGVVFIDIGRSGLCLSFVGGNRASPEALRWRFAPDSPRLSACNTHRVLVYAAL